MTTKVEKTLLVDVPVRVAYNQWTQFEEFPQFMGGVSEVKQMGDRRLHWVAEIAGVKRQWDAEVLEQVPDTKIAWAATEGATNAGVVYFSEAGVNRTSVTLSLEYEPEGLVEAVGDKLNIVEKQVEADLERFKKLVESRGYDTGGWRGTVNAGGAPTSPGVEAAAASRGDKGKAGFSKAAKAAGAFAAAFGVVAAGALKGAREGADTVRKNRASTQPLPPVRPAPATTPVAVEEAIEAEEARATDEVLIANESTRTPEPPM
ncbi:MAG: cyclase/dehydrase [uncultured Acidimicrobiales bacterium]|uniref:Cyclase/dehydrase n=1 Tax=uncultured Acidimicrobiales bacterium TaxID=310071 RepID=A0A6J4HWE1_9ACTN|nr:MAG: cyclase/dehydrase [uncultured Acidimicrobiales bacterium]